MEDLSEILTVPSYYKRTEDAFHVKGSKSEVGNQIGTPQNI
jgi:hypothetical protein